MLGVLTREGLVAGFARGGGGTAVTELMQSVPAVPPWHRIDDLAPLLSGDAPAVAVVEPGGQLAGLITRDNLFELMLVGEARRQYVARAARRVTGTAPASPLQRGQAGT